jgi:uncharacterized membrane protein YbaN (DUF454 family)
MNGVKTRRNLSRPVRWVLDGVGLLGLALGTIGIFVPGWPTTVFWIVAVLCFLKTRPAAVRPLLRTPVVGPAIRWFLRWRPFRRR